MWESLEMMVFITPCDAHVVCRAGAGEGLYGVGVSVPGVDGVREHQQQPGVHHLLPSHPRLGRLTA
jgi:hypothetical protein